MAIFSSSAVSSSLFGVVVSFSSEILGIFFVSSHGTVALGDLLQPVPRVSNGLQDKIPLGLGVVVLVVALVVVVELLLGFGVAVLVVVAYDGLFGSWPWFGARHSAQIVMILEGKESNLHTKKVWRHQEGAPGF